jgi:hypothetical protein
VAECNDEEKTVRMIASIATKAAYDALHEIVGTDNESVSRLAAALINAYPGRLTDAATKKLGLVCKSGPDLRFDL